MKRGTILVTFLALAFSPSTAQFSGFMSASSGYHQNPLYNYERASDQLKQTYLELNYVDEFEASTLKFSYVNGMMIFNRFTDRNYFEHNLLARYAISFHPTPTATARLSDDEDVEEPDEDVSGEQSREDSTGSFLDMSLKLGARHDKTVFKEFDNVGSSLSASYRFSLGEMFYLRISNILDYRRYVYLDELSNITDACAIQLGVASSESFTYGVRAGVGLKHFTSSLYDTARFESQRTYVLKPTGKGKPGAKVKVPSDKQILVNSESDNITQLTAGTFIQTTWSDGLAAVEFLFRRNPGLPSRYLAQYANTSILSEDIYNDHFSYEGPEVQLRVRQTLPFGLQSILTLEHQRKEFGAHAVSLAGDQIADHRLDSRSSVELYLSQYVELSESLGLDVALGSEFLRNQSNDDYNDYSLYNISLSIGIGF